MKYILFVALFIAALLPNCKKEHIIIKTPEPIDTIVPIDTVQHIIDLGQSAVLKNGVLWNAPSPCGAFYEYLTKRRFSLKGRKTYANSGLTETAFIKDIPLVIGKHSITMTRSLSDFNNGIADAGYTMANYDEGIGNFDPDTTRTDNFIEAVAYRRVQPPIPVRRRFERCCSWLEKD